MVRIACHFYEVKQSLKILKELKRLGYKVAINLMQISEQSDKKILEISKKLAQTNLDILYFADSLGSMKINDIDKIIKGIKTFWKGNIGVHMHNNLGQALQNNNYCMEQGIQWIDSTILGMGRGAGNAATEQFIIEYKNFFKKKLDIISLQNLISQEFTELKNKYKWGTNSFYYLAGKYGIHPTYIQEMISTGFNNSEIFAAIDQLKNNEGSKYNVDLVRAEFQKDIKIKNGNWSPLKKIKGKEVLLVASGPKSIEYLNSIEKVVATAKLNKKSLGIMVNNQDELKMYSDLGFNIIAVGTEMSILSRSISQILQ